MTFQHHDGSAGIARLPNPMSPLQEFESLGALVGRSLDRMRELKEAAFPLPASGLVQAAPGVLLFKGGRHARDAHRS